MTFISGLIDAFHCNGYSPSTIGESYIRGTIVSIIWSSQIFLGHSIVQFSFNPELIVVTLSSTAALNLRCNVISFVRFFDLLPSADRLELETDFVRCTVVHLLIHFSFLIRFRSLLNLSTLLFDNSIYLCDCYPWRDPFNWLRRNEFGWLCGSSLCFIQGHMHLEGWTCHEVFTPSVSGWPNPLPQPFWGTAHCWGVSSTLLLILWSLSATWPLRNVGGFVPLSFQRRRPWPINWHHRCCERMPVLATDCLAPHAPLPHPWVCSTFPLSWPGRTGAKISHFKKSVKLLNIRPTGLNVGNTLRHIWRLQN